MSMDMERWKENLMKTIPAAVGAACAVAFSLAMPGYAADSSDQANPPGSVSSKEEGRGSRETLAPAPSADTSQTAQQPLPQGTSPAKTTPAESQVGADPKKSKTKRDPAGQNPAQPVQAEPPAADAHAEGARGPRDDDESRARAGVPEYQGPVQEPGQPADPNVRKQESAR